METTVRTSALVRHRADVVVPERMAAITAAIKNRDFETFGRITMQVPTVPATLMPRTATSSTQCVWTRTPPSRTSTTRRVPSSICARATTAMRAKSRSSLLPLTLSHSSTHSPPPPCSLQAAYTFDAGPNAVIYCRQQHVDEILSLVAHFFPPEAPEGCFLYGVLTPVSTVAAPRTPLLPSPPRLLPSPWPPAQEHCSTCYTPLSAPALACSRRRCVFLVAVLTCRSRYLDPMACHSELPLLFFVIFVLGSNKQ
jgi:hypothetical protein